MVPHASSIHYNYTLIHLGLGSLGDVFNYQCWSTFLGNVFWWGETLISRIFLMTWVCSPSLCKCAASWVASLANPVIAIWVSPGEPEDVLNFSSSRHISSYLVHLWGLRLRSICHRLFQDVSRSLKHSSTVLKLVAFAKWSVKAFFFWFTPSFTTKSDLCEILWNRFRSSQNCHSTSSLTPLCWLVQLRSLPLELSIHWMCGKMRKALGFPAASFNLALGTLGPSAKISHQNRWFSQPETAIFDGDIYLSVDRQVNKDPFWMVTHVLFA